MDKQTEIMKDLDERIKRFNHCSQSEDELKKHARFMRLSLQSMRSRMRDNLVSKEYAEMAIVVFKDEIKRLETALFGEIEE